MSIFSTIMSKIFGTTPATAEPPPAAAPGTPPPVPGAASISPGTAPGAAPAAAPGAAPAAPVDVVAVLSAMPNPQKLNWRSSIVDLMKLLGLDSSLDNRKELAKELGYTSDTNDSASMNIWLHKQVMNKLAQNGGVVPAELKD